MPIPRPPVPGTPYAGAVRRTLACFAAASLLAISSAGCTGGSSTGHHKPEHGQASSVITRPQVTNLLLARGRASARYVITAPNPAKYAFNVRVTARASTDVSVRIRTWYGAVFPSILVSSHQQGTCSLKGSEDVCAEHFPLLPAERPGAWTVIAAKPTGPATTVRIAITFLRS
jgi:hypothetical protein